MRPLSIIAIILVIIGGLNWLLVGAFHTDLVASLFGPMSTISRAVYVLVGLAAIYLMFVTPRLLPRARSLNDARTPRAL